MCEALGQAQRISGLQTSPSCVPPTAISNLHCSRAPSPNTSHIPLRSDLANFRKRLLQLSMLFSSTHISAPYPSFLPSLLPQSKRYNLGFHHFLFT